MMKPNSFFGSFGKCFLILCNCIFSVIGLTFVFFGIYIEAKTSNFLNLFTSDEFHFSSIFIISLGGIMFLLASIGCYGAVAEDSCMMYTYGTLIFVIIIVQTAIGVASLYLKDQFKDVVKENMEKTMPRYPRGGGTMVSWDVLQKKFECCGVDSYEDWETIFSNKARLPDSCVIGCEEEDCGFNYSRNKIFKDGCLKKLSKEMRENLKIFGGIALGATLIELITAVLSYAVAHYKFH